MDASPTTVVVSPGFAGGRLKTFNLILCALQTNQVQRQKEACLVLDENLFNKQDLRFPVQNAHGDVVYLEVPDHGKLSHASRVAYQNALADSLPETLEGQAAIAHMLPPALATPLEAAVEFWTGVFPNLSIETVKRGDTSPGPSSGGPGITWGSARHFHTIKELGLELAWIFESEARCHEELIPVPAGALGEATLALREAMSEHLSAVKERSADVDPNLIGAWSRLRRNMREDLDQFAAKAERCGNSRHGILRHRVHALAQALRPHDLPQEDHLSLMSAATSFQLHYQDQERCITSLNACQGPERLLRTS